MQRFIHVACAYRRFGQSAFRGGTEFLGATAVLAAAGFACVAVVPQALNETPQPAMSAEVAPNTDPGWNNWQRVKDFLGLWQSRAPTHVPLPTDKLACHRPRAGNPVVLVSCGSFNPPTVMHLRMLELAREELRARGYDVLGAYLSPVNDAYWKRSLAPGRHRVRMCQLAIADSDFIMVDPWEVEQHQYTRTLHVLNHIKNRLADMMAPKDEERPNEDIEGKKALPQVMLVCGADVLEAMADPGIWRPDLLEKLLAGYGVVCISRDGAGAEAAQVLQSSGTLLHRYHDHIILVQDPVPNNVSSTAVRYELEQGRSVKYLLPPGVEGYVHQHGLYGTHKRAV